MDLEATVDPTGTMSQEELNTADISNIMDLLNSQNDSLNNLGNVFNIANIVPYSHTITSGDFNNKGFFYLAIPHGLQYEPIVIASVQNTSDGAIRLLPFIFHVADQSYYITANNYSASIVIDSVDTNNINVRIDANDVSGLAWLAANSVLNFIFYCLQQPSAPSS